ncbi:putative MFS family arabinose efflux permease [Bradyrhizobium sp. USDA 4472]
MKHNAITAPHGLAAAQVVLALGELFIGTGEFAAMGLLPGMAESIDVSIPKAGNLISAYALGVVVGSPLLAVLTLEWSGGRCWWCLLRLSCSAMPRRH